MRETASNRGYNSRWRKARLHYLQQNPLCIMCKQSGHTNAATVVDHIKPHKGDTTLFWEVSNWQPLCAIHHNSTKQRGENQGYDLGCDVSGLPIDANHHWNK